MSEISTPSSSSAAANIGPSVLPSSAQVPASPVGVPTPQSSQPPTWRHAILTGEHAVFADHPSLAKFNNPADALKSYVTLQEKMGTMMPALRPDSDEATKAEFYKRIGVPDTVDGYKFEPPKELPQGMIHDIEMDKKFADWCHRNKVTPEAAQGIRQEFIKDQSERFGQVKTAMEQQNQEALKSLKVRWGERFNEHVENAKLAIKEYAPPELRAMLNKMPEMGNNPHVIEMFARLGAQLAQDSAKGHLSSGGSVATLQSSQAAARLSYLKTDAAFIKSYTNPRDPGYAKANSEMKQLYAIAYPEEQASPGFI